MSLIQMMPLTHDAPVAPLGLRGVETRFFYTHSAPLGLGEIYLAAGLSTNINGDGTTNILDLTLVAQQFNQ